MTTDSIISKVWSFCHTLRDDGDCLEQLGDEKKAPHGSERRARRQSI